MKWIALFLVLLYGVIGFIAVPNFIVNNAPQIVNEQTNGNLYIGDATFNPFLFELSISDIYFTPPDHSEFVALEEFRLNYELYSLVMGKFHFESIALIRPDINIVKDSNSSFNFAWLLELGGNEAKEPAKSEELPPVRISNFVIEEGVVHYADQSKGIPFEADMTPINLHLKNIDTTNNSNDSDTIRLIAGFHDGGKMDLNSRIISLKPFALEGTFDYEAGKLFTGWSYLQEKLNLEVADGKVKVHARYSVDTANLDAMRIDELQFALNRLRVIPKDGAHHDLLNIKSITLNDGVIEPMRQRVRLDKITIDDVGIAALRYKDGTLDWQHYIAQVEADTQEKTVDTASDVNATQPWDVLLNDFALSNLHVNFDDRSVVPEAHFKIDALNLSANNISSLAQIPLHYAMDLQMNQTMRCQSSGDVSHSTLNAKGTFGCKGIDLTWFNPYVDGAAQNTLKKYDVYVGSGISAFNVNYAATEKESIEVALSESKVSLDGFALKQKKSNYTLFSIKKVAVEGIGADTAKRNATIASFAVNSPYIYASLDRHAILNWNRLIVPNESSGKKTQAKSGDVPWHLMLNKFELDKGSLHFKDHTLGKAVNTRLDRINVTANNIDSAEKTSLKYSASMRLNRTGKIKARGKLQHTPLYHNGTLNIANVHLEDFNPYVSKDHHINLKRGLLFLKSSIKYAPSDKKADAKVSGSINVEDFVLENALDNTVLLAWSEVAVSPFTFEHNPNKLFVKEVNVDSFYTNAIIDTNGTMNFAKLSKHPQIADENSSEEEKIQEAEAFPMQIVKVRLNESSADFADFSLPLHFQAHIHDFSGDIYGISSNKKETSHLEFNGVVNEYGSAKLKGTLNTAAIEKFTDLNFVFRNIDLVNMSPYSGKFIGQRIANGKLFLDLNYNIIDSQMVGENSIIVKKLELGEDVESEEAIDLPLGLAIALLEDSDGVIDLELPVSGDMNNPEFSYGHIIFKAFFNLLTKAVTAPFSLLGAMLGIDGDALEYVEFEPGSSVVLPPEQEKLDKLSKALIKRPKLQLALHGSFNESYDIKALKNAKLLDIAVSKAKEEGDLFEGNVRKETLEELYEELLGDDQLEALEERLLKKFKDNDDAFEKTYDTAMIENLSSVQNVTPQELDLLALQRAQGIRVYLVESKNIESTRIEVGESVAESESEGKWVKTKMELVVK